MDTQLMYLGVADTDPDDSFGYGNDSLLFMMSLLLTACKLYSEPE